MNQYTNEFLTAVLNALDAEHDTILGQSRVDTFVLALKANGYEIVQIKTELDFDDE